MVEGLCQGRQHCGLVVGPRLLMGSQEEPCPAARRSLTVEYKCRPAFLQSRVSCPDQPLLLSCPPSLRLTIFSALLSPHPYCPAPSNPPPCPPLTITPQVSALCHAQSSCSLSSLLPSIPSLPSSCYNISSLQTTSSCIEQEMFLPHLLAPPATPPAPDTSSTPPSIPSRGPPSLVPDLEDWGPSWEPVYLQDDQPVPDPVERWPPNLPPAPPEPQPVNTLVSPAPGQPPGLLQDPLLVATSALTLTFALVLVVILAKLYQTFQSPLHEASTVESRLSLITGGGGEGGRSLQGEMVQGEEDRMFVRVEEDESILDTLVCSQEVTVSVQQT